MDADRKKRGYRAAATCKNCRYCLTDGGFSGVAGYCLLEMENISVVPFLPEYRNDLVQVDPKTLPEPIALTHVCDKYEPRRGTELRRIMRKADSGELFMRAERRSHEKA